jgi:HD-GYP domain-containing protein (c-di-GMP phosphodiesterase class II)
MRQPAFRAFLEEETVQAVVLAMAPPTAADQSSDDVDTMCEALADFAEIKARSTWSHSRAVAEVATAIGTRLGLRAAELTRLRRVALLHDLGMTAPPLRVIEKEAAGRLGDHEAEMDRWHTYYTQRVLERVGPFAELADEAAAHHERVDGRGYHRRLSREQIPLLSRAVAVAEAFARLTARQDRPMDPEAALSRLRPGAGSALDRETYEALVLAVWSDSQGGRPRGRPRHTGTLTARETEVLQLLASVMSNPQIAKVLVVSRKTVEHHVEKIFNKLGVSSRTAAVVYAVQNGIC